MRTSDGRLIFGIFSASNIPDYALFFNTWNKLAHENGIKGFEFFAFVQGKEQLKKLPEGKYDRIVYDALNDTFKTKSVIRNFIDLKILKRPLRLADYKDYVSSAIKIFRDNSNFTPCIDPMFDHSPRSQHRNAILTNDDPKKWGELCKAASDIVLESKDIDRLLFIKAWNEWGEGNYLEPDIKFGRRYLEECRKVFLGL